ncbi:DUF3572 domain-containing protein [Palleronia rufa]|uniref:DUF3572 domain-containing protein n=1 Tax=Palleronia rufa TaxID=1530186 RepID=UPI00055A3B68|nr:DUF3572 domain-containing protein [Palleronia rufa]
MRQEHAQSLARDVVLWLVAEEDLLGIFMGATGCDASAIRAGVESPDFLASVLDFVLMDDRWILAFCAQSGTPPERVRQARQALPGGEEVHWT